MNTTYISVTETAKLLREALKKAFPNQKFSVKSKKYSGGASIDIRWMDGVSSARVEKVCALYEGATFDPTIDLKSPHYSLLSLPNGETEKVHFGADYIFAEREYSQETLDKFAQKIGKEYGLSIKNFEEAQLAHTPNANGRHWLSGRIFRILQETDL